MVFGVAVFVGCLLSAIGVAPPEQPPAAAASVPLKTDFVHVNYQFVTVELPNAVPARTPARLARAAPPRALPVTRTHTAGRPFLARARQLVLGNGRARPQPFPRVPGK